VRDRAIALAVGTVAVLAWCGWVSGFHRSTTAAEVTWACSLAAVLIVDGLLSRGRRVGSVGWHLEPVADQWPRPGLGGTRRALLGVGPWLALIVVTLAWDVLALDSGPHSYHLTISALSQAYRPLNAALLLVWIACGVGYQMARVRAPRAPTRTEGQVRAGPEGTEMAAAFGAAGPSPRGHLASVSALLLPSSPPLGIAFWVALPVAALVVDIVARRSAGRLATAEEFVRFVSTPRTANLVLVAAWLFAGYHLFAR
jgi:hypothetical protein